MATEDATTIDLTRNEKKRAAGNSVLAALGLTGMKLVVGLISGSLGILAEAAHSGLDLVAALITFIAVSVSDRPADESHTYGHGKVENFSALVETLLLFVTCAWIIYEAYMRIFVRSVEVDPSPKSQRQDVGFPVDASVNWTVWPNAGEAGLYVKAAISEEAT